MNFQPADDLPVVIIGAGPVGLAAAAHLHQRGLPALVLEAGAGVGSSVRQWGHVRLFSPWRHLIDPAARRLLDRHGWRAPDPDARPTGAELVTDLLEPMAALPEVAPWLRFGHRVRAVTRLGFDRMKTTGREASPFQVIADGPRGEVRLLARGVIDASGTWTQPNPLGSGGVPAAGEATHAARISYRVPDVLGFERKRYAGKRTLVVGGGHSAFNAVIDLATLARQVPGTDVVWAVRRENLGQMFGGGAADQLTERGALGERARELVDERGVEFVAGFQVASIVARGSAEVNAAGSSDDKAEGSAGSNADDTAGAAVGTATATAGRLSVTAYDGRSLTVDEIVATTGFRPELGITRELRLELDPITEAPVRLAPLIDPNVHSCGSVPPHGEAELAHPEPGFYTVGMKSYGRAPTFLLLTGYEQVRSIAAYLAGDLEAARRVELTLPETGVCSSDLPGNGVACCGAQAVDLPLVNVELGA